LRNSKMHAALVLVLAAGFASGGPITYELVGDISGTLSATPVTNAPFDMTVVGDTTGVVLSGGDNINPASASSLFIGGLTGDFTSSNIVAGDNPSGGVGGLGTTSKAFIALTNSGFSGWNLASSLGPLTGSAAIASTSAGSGIPNTTLGPLSITGASSLSFVASTNPLTNYIFSGTCAIDDCTGTSTGILVLQNYTPGNAITAANFLEFLYQSSVLGTITITSSDLSSISGILSSSPGGANIIISNSDLTLDSQSNGSWCASCASDKVWFRRGLNSPLRSRRPSQVLSFSWASA
jgi:hypothetical protein